MGTRKRNIANAMLSRPSQIATIVNNLPCPPDAIIAQSRDNMTVLKAVMLWELYDDWSYELALNNYERRSRHYVNAASVLSDWLKSEYNIRPLDVLMPNPAPINNPFKKIFGENHD